MITFISKNNLVENRFCSFFSSSYSLSFKSRQEKSRRPFLDRKIFPLIRCDSTLRYDESQSKNTTVRTVRHGCYNELAIHEHHNIQCSEGKDNISPVILSKKHHLLEIKNAEIFIHMLLNAAYK